MKKVALGCLVALVLLGAAGAGVAYYVYRQARQVYTQFAELGQATDIERGIRVQSRYEPPLSGEVTEAQLERLVAVQTTIRQSLGTRVEDFQAKYKVLSDKRDATIADAPMLLAAYRDLASHWLDAKRTQVRALNDAGLSLDEYKWIRQRAYEAAGIPFMDFDVGQIVEEIRRGNSSPSDNVGRLSGSLGPTGPMENRTRAEKFKKQLADNAALASFGL